MNTNTVWREFDEQKITHSATHYLFSIHELLNKNGYARAVDISKSLGITPGSCSTGLKNLAKKEFIIEDENKFIKLTYYGEKLIKEIKNNRKNLIDFFENKLGIDSEKALVNACKIEHLIDPEIVEKIKNLK